MTRRRKTDPARTSATNVMIYGREGRPQAVHCMREADRRRHLALARRIWRCRVQIEGCAQSIVSIPLLVFPCPVTSQRHVSRTSSNDSPCLLSSGRRILDSSSPRRLVDHRVAFQRSIHAAPGLQDSVRHISPFQG